MFSIKKNKTTSTLWHVLIPMSGVTLLASATGGMSGDIFNLLVKLIQAFEITTPTTR